MPVTPRTKDEGSAVYLSALRQLGTQRSDVDTALRANVRAARDSGASIRVIAEHSGLSTRTVQDWLKQD